MEHQFRITCKGKSKVISVNGTQEYALSYISGYVQALRDRFGTLITIKVQTKESITDKTKKSFKSRIDQWN